MTYEQLKKHENTLKDLTKNINSLLNENFLITLKNNNSFINLCGVNNHNVNDKHAQQLIEAIKAGLIEYAAPYKEELRVVTEKLNAIDTLLKDVKVK
jgi:uncharacterized protein (DUF342 family)